MPIDPEKTLYYRRARFSTRLPRERFYVRSHYWLLPCDGGLWRIGVTQFATRMLGDLVEYSFDVAPGDVLRVGQALGWVEGFKAVSDIFCPLDGEFVRSNPVLERNPSLVDNDPYDRGWLYEVRGEPERDRMDVDAYVALLDATIDRMLDQAGQGDDACPVPNTS